MRRALILLLASAGAFPSGSGASAFGVAPCGPVWTVDTVAITGHLHAVSMLSVDDSWAVGGPRYRGGRHAQVLRWNGTGWSSVPFTVESGSSEDSLHDVETFAANDVWAVGSYTELGTGSVRALIERWNGATWLQYPFDAGRQPRLSGLDATGPDDLWAVGVRWANRHEHGVALHWDGIEWSQVPIPSTPGVDRSLEDVVALAPDDVWAVGRSYGSRGARPLILHWDGVAWAKVKGADIGAGEGALFGVDGVGQELWAVGYRLGGDRALIERWTGAEWVRSPTPRSGAYASLSGIGVATGDLAWAVGYSAHGPVDLRWNGTAWVQVDTPNPRRTYFLEDAAVLPSGEAFAVGYHDPDPYILRRCDTVPDP